MNKKHYFFFLLCFPFCVFAQKGEPLRIIFKYYYGSDYRNDTLRGYYDLVDKVVYKKIKATDDKYVIDSITYVEKIARRGEDPVKWVILDDKPEPKKYNEYLADVQLYTFLRLLDTSNYRQVKIDRASDFGEQYKGNFLIPKDFSLAYYDIDTTFFDCFCKFYEKKLRQTYAYGDYPYPGRNCDEKVDFKDFTERLIMSEDRNISISSYLSTFSISVEYTDNKVELYQKYPSAYTAWRFYDNNEKRVTIINPKINDAIMEILPKSAWRRDFNFDGYKDMEQLYNLYLEKY